MRQADRRKGGRPNHGEEQAMRCKTHLLSAVLGLLGTCAAVTSLSAQSPWRGAGAQPCFGPEGGSYECPRQPGPIALRAGRLFDSKTGRMLTDQVVLITDDRITDVGPAAQIKIPDGARVIDLSQATV